MILKRVLFFEYLFEEAIGRSSIFVIIQGVFTLKLIF